MTRSGFTADRRDVLVMSTGAILASCAFEGEAVAAAAMVRGFTMGRDQAFDDGWLFHRGGGDALERSGLDDSGWRTVDLPHDWSIEDVPGGVSPSQIGPFDKKADGGTATGFTQGGEGWYRKHFRLDGVPADSRVEVFFDGVYCECDVWLNGKKLGSHLNGYAPFSLDLTPALLRGADNVLAVHVRNFGKNSRWYSGSGIYRQVTLDVLPAAGRLARWGVAAWTRRIENGRAEIELSTTVESFDPALTVVTRLRDESGRVVAESTGSAAAEVKQQLSVRGPRLWSPDEPNLYRLETELRRGRAIVDSMSQNFGLRIVTMDVRQGLQINGKRTILRGGSVHHDNGLLGASAFGDADERRVRILKARGFNALRSSHNPVSRNLRDACDRVGMLLIDEAFDMWHVAKNPDDYAKHFRSDWQGPLTAMVMSGRNSPSVIMWSIGNEVPDRSTAEGIEWSWKLANTVRGLDPTRPVTGAVNGLLGPLMEIPASAARAGQVGKPDNSSTAFLDVSGYNYRLDDIERDFAQKPDRIVYGSETFPKEAYDYYALAQRAPYMLGEFVWTAMDYLGEAGIGASANINAAGVPFYLPGWPWMNAWCGDIDLIGDQKAPSRYRDVVWGLSKLEMAVQRPVPEGKREFISSWGWSDELPSWTWHGYEGKRLAVRLYTPGDRVELLLNGSKVGEKVLTAADKIQVEIEVPYAPGRLEAVAYSKGRVIARRAFETVSAAAKLRLRSERLKVSGGRQRLAFISLDVLDASNRLLPDDQRKVALTIDGPAELVGFGSANPLAVGSFQAKQAETYRGRALAILRSTGQKGTVRVVARSGDLVGASVSVQMV